MSRRSQIQSALALVALLGGAGCAGTSETVREELLRTQTTIQQVQRAGIVRETGRLELEQAKDSLTEARRQLEHGRQEDALRWAAKARLQADLAQAKARNYQAQRAAAELQASIEQLRREVLPSAAAPSHTSNAPHSVASETTAVSSRSAR